jgi:hypothetical protein
MALKYTSFDRLAKKLRGRLNLGSNLPENSEINNTLNSLFAYTPSASEQSVDLKLIEEIAEQEDAFLELVLSQLYVLPFKFTSDVTVNIIGSISEGFILSSLLSVHFQGTSPGIIASDISSATIDWRRQSEYKLNMLVAGEGIWYPTSLQAPNPQINVPQTQALRLPGEVLLGQSQRPDLITRNYTAVGKRSNNNNAFFGDRCGGCQPRRDGSALGSNPEGYCVKSNNYPDYEVFS